MSQSPQHASNVNHPSRASLQRQSSYAGIGSRKTPPAILALMRSIATGLAEQGWVLRTGLARGADQAFYCGTPFGRAVELYLPWPSFEKTARRPDPHEFVLAEPSEAALAIASRFHPAWCSLTHGVQRLHGRNTHQILGADLATPARFVLCWTPDGSLDGRGPQSGGTGQALRIAHDYGISVFNLARADHAERVRSALLDNA